tara:strand:- start:18071 stop:18580 length:510 start_codon:yes stop_codon:yes gene_type:complete
LCLAVPQKLALRWRNAFCEHGVKVIITDIDAKGGTARAELAKNKGAIVIFGSISAQVLPGLALCFAGATGATGIGKFDASNWTTCPVGQSRFKAALASLSCRVTSPWATEFNTERPHSALDYQTPTDHARTLITAIAHPAARDESSARRAIAQTAPDGVNINRSQIVTG